MSRDQKPGRVKVYSGGQDPARPMRRASDMVEVAADENVAAGPASAGSNHWFLSALFVVGCIAGGSICVALPHL